MLYVHVLLSTAYSDSYSDSEMVVMREFKSILKEREDNSISQCDRFNEQLLYIFHMFVLVCMDRCIFELLCCYVFCVLIFTAMMPEI